MMEYLIDTHALLWWDSTPERIGSEALQIFRNPENILIVSHASIWELAIKIRLGKLQMPHDLDTWLKKFVISSGFILQPISLDAILYTQNLPMHHGDPFDRLLISQAHINTWPVLSADSQWDAYPVQRIW